MSWLISFVLAWLSWEERDASDNFKKKTCSPRLDLNHKHSAYEADALTIALRIWFDGVFYNVEHVFK